MPAVSTPNDPAVEASLLGGILLSPDLLAEIDDQLAAEDFFDTRHVKIYQAIVDLNSANQAIDVLTVANQLKKQKELDLVGGNDYLQQMVGEIPTINNLKDYARIILGKSRRRGLIKVGGEVSQMGQDESQEVTEILEEAEKKLFAISDRQTVHRAENLEQLLEDKFKRLEQLAENKDSLRGLPTGFADLDKKLGGLQPSDLFILAARPAMGKTSLALNIAYNIATESKKTVLFFSIEMSKEQLVDRLLSIGSGIDAWRIRNGQLEDRDFKELNQTMGELSEAKLFIDDSVGLNISQLRTKVRRLHHRLPIDLVVVDYLQLMTSDRRGGDFNRVQEISEISRGLKLIAREINIPVMVLSQLSRAVEKREGRDKNKPQLSDLRDSGAIEQDADIVSFIYREDYYNPETDRQNLVDIMIRKHRNGPTGQVEVVFNPERQRYFSIDRKASETG